MYNKKFHITCNCCCACYSSNYCYNSPRNICLGQYSICHCLNKKLLPMSYRKLSSMPSKAGQPSAYVLAKDNGGKLKNKSQKAKNIRKNVTTEKESEGKQYLEATCTKKGSHEVINKTDSGHLSTTSDMKKKCDSDDNICVCRCSCKPLNKTCQGIERPEMVLLPCYGLPLKKNKKYILDSSYNGSQESITNSNCDIAYTDQIVNMVRKSTRGVSGSSSSNANKQCSDCEKSNFIGCTCSFGSTNSRSPNRRISCQCSCKTKHTKVKRNSCSVCKNLCQLDVINEEEAEMEIEKQNECLENTGISQNTDSNEDIKAQKSLEDTCADFLNIVTDNILESVQKSVCTSLQDYCCKTTERIDMVCHKLEKNEQNMKCLYENIVEKISARNENNFKQILALLEQLTQTQDNKNNVVLKIVCQNQESQCDAGEDLRKNSDDKDVAERNANSEEKQPTISVSPEESEQKNDSESFDDSEEYIREQTQGCHCAGGKTKSLKTTKIRRSYSSSTIIQKPGSSDSLLDSHEKPRHSNEHKKRESGGAAYELDIQKKEVTSPTVNFFGNSTLSDTEALYLRGKPLNLLNRFEDKTTLVEKFYNLEPNISLNTISNSSQKSTPSTRSNSPHMYTCFSIQPNGKKEFNCNCSLKKYTTTDCKSVNTSQLDFYESYDTSGYASEPEDNNEIIDSNNMPKKTLKTIPVRLQYVRQNNTSCNEPPIENYSKNKKHSKKRSVKADRSKPTRLSRL